MRNVAIYARKSSESEDRQVLSIDSQVRELKALAVRERLTVDRVLTESKSAKSPGRSVFNELFGLVQKGKIDTIICWKLDRLARNPVDGGAVIWAMEEQKLLHICTPGRTFQNTANDKFWMQLEFGMAKKYVDDLSDNVKRGMRAKLEQGWLPGLPPLGYVNERNLRTVIPDPERFQVVRRMWDLMLTGAYTPPRILRIATRDWGLRTRTFKRQGGCPLIDSMVQKIFRNPFYYGVIRRKGVEYVGAHRPMVTKEEFDRVQALLAGRQHPRPKERSFPFTGLIACGECGAAVTAEYKRNRQGHEYIYYHCTKRKAGVKCGQRVIEARRLEAQIVSFLESVSISERLKQWAIEVVDEVHRQEAEKAQASLASLKRRHTACQQELSNLLDLRVRGLLTDEEYLAKKNQLTEEQTRLSGLIGGGNHEMSAGRDRLVQALEFASVAKDRFVSGSPDFKRLCVCHLGSNLTLKDGKLSIHAQKPFEFIQKTIKGADTQRRGFEPAILGERQQGNRPEKSPKSSWWALRDEVRTYFRQQLINLRANSEA